MRIASRCAARLWQLPKVDDEKKLLLNVLSRYPSPEGLSLAAELVKTPSLKFDAYRSIVTIVQKVGADSPQVQPVLAEAGLRQAKIEILKAEYGAKERTKDVTALVRSCAHGFPMIPLMKASYNEAFGGDPAPGVMKELKIEYRLNDKAGKAAFAENAAILLPTP